MAFHVKKAYAYSLRRNAVSGKFHVWEGGACPHLKVSNEAYPHLNVSNEACPHLKVSNETCPHLKV